MSPERFVKGESERTKNQRVENSRRRGIADFESIWVQYRRYALWIPIFVQTRRRSFQRSGRERG